MARPPLPPPPLLDPAWYPDPTGRYEARYWDGRKWTSHISHYGATGADPLLRARFDHWWLRGLFRLALWAAFFGGLWWAYNEYWPTDELSYGWKTHGWSIPDHGYTHYWKMFNSRQLVVHTLLLREIMQAYRSRQ